MNIINLSLRWHTLCFVQKLYQLTKCCTAETNRSRLLYSHKTLTKPHTKLKSIMSSYRKKKNLTHRISNLEQLLVRQSEELVYMANDDAQYYKLLEEVCKHIFVAQDATNTVHKLDKTFNIA